MVETNLLIDTQDRGEWSVVAARGEVDLYTAPSLKEELVSLVDRGRTRIAVDLSGVEFLDSTGLGVLIGGLKRCREGDGVLVLIGPRAPVQKVLSVTGLDTVFPIHQRLEQATG
jgi:anti-sigma B factor antagonist